MWFMLAICSMITFGIAGFLMKVSSVQKGSTNFLLLGLYASGTLGFVWWTYVEGSFSWSNPVILAGIIIGLGSAVGNLFFMQALEHGPASLTAPLINSNIVLTVLMALFLFNEKITPLEIIGIILLLIAISMLPIDPSEKINITSKKWYLLILMATLLFFLRNGGLKITEELQLSNTSILFYSYLCGMLLFATAILKQNKEPSYAIKKGLLWGLSSGVFSFAGMQLYIVALKTGPASIVSPIFASNSLLIAVLSIFIYKERLSTIQTICLSLFFCGLVLIRIS